MYFVLYNPQFIYNAESKICVSLPTTFNNVNYDKESIDFIFQSTPQRQFGHAVQ